MSTKTDGTRDKGRMVRRRDFVSGLMTGIGAGALVSYTEVPAAAAAPAARPDGTGGGQEAFRGGDGPGGL
jgi:hypothetical protein